MSLPNRIPGANPNLVLEVDRESGVIIHVDPALEATFGYSPGGLAGRHVSALSDAAPDAGARKSHAAQVFSDATHDLVGPLNQVSTLIALLIRKNPVLLDAPDSSQVLEHIQTAVNRMRMLAGGLKRLAGALGEPMTVAAVEAGELLKSAIENCRRENLLADVDISCGDLPTVFADKRRMVFVFEELIRNAIKFRGGRLLHIEISASAADGAWLFSVRDDGSGFEPRSAQEIFRIFRRLDVAVPGSGVGLTICRQILEQHNGQMWAEAEPGRGAVIHFTLADPAFQSDGEYNRTIPAS